MVWCLWGERTVGRHRPAADQASWTRRWYHSRKTSACPPEGSHRLSPNQPASQTCSGPPTNSTRRHLEFIIFVHFGQMVVYFRCHWCLCKKSKMAPIQAQKIMFLGSFDPQTLFFIIEETCSRPPPTAYAAARLFSRFHATLCLHCLQREACLRSAACFSVLLRHECVLRHDALQYCGATYGGPFGCSGLLIWRLVSSVVDTCHVTMSCSVLTCAGRLLDVRVSRPGCRGRAYACLRLYTFDRDGVPCWPACTRHLCNDGSWKPTDNIISEQSTDLQSAAWTVCTDVTGPVAVSFLADTMNLQYSYLTAECTRDFFETIVRYINVHLLLTTVRVRKFYPRMSFEHYFSKTNKF